VNANVTGCESETVSGSVHVAIGNGVASGCENGRHRRAASANDEAANGCANDVENGYENGHGRHHHHCVWK
jgi:hypothetical protein